MRGKWKNNWNGKLWIRKIILSNNSKTNLSHEVIKSEWLVFKEVTQGPFNKKDTVFAPWRPDDKNIDSIKEYIKKLT